MEENFSFFDVAGHLDYITRFGPIENKRYEMKAFASVIDAIFKALIHKDRGIEVNTSGLRGSKPRLFPQAEVLSRYRELGGGIVAIGSDSHFNEHYYAGISEAMVRLKQLNSHEISSFIRQIETSLSLTDHE